MTGPNIPSMRLQSQQLDCQRFKKPEEIIAWFGGVQAQDYPGAKWAIAQRLEDCTDVNIEQAFAEKKFVRTWAMRGTLHFVTASDIRWIMELLGPRIIARNARRYKELELDEETLKRSNEVLKNALQEGERLNRRELVTILQENGISTEGQRAPYMLQRASLDGLICQEGMHSNNNPIFISMVELPKTKTLTRHYALAELAKRYFTSHGPATIQDFTWWSGLLTKDAKAGLEAVKSSLESETIGDKTYWYLGSKLKHSSPRVHLLPSFDEYIVGYKDRSASLEKIHSKNESIKNMMYPTIAIDGQIVGTWKRRFNKNEVMVELKPSIALNATECHILDDAAYRFGEFLEIPVHTTIIS
ncbi:winged helix DNA-binding domain-containing protein [Methanobacterium sp. ACI-7]|uniref:winged helix DNA-binding domain-containing protein n=1 Tax=unclassified Methanobacterium TaxID=2627676 RepID=UPI0039C034CA